MDPTRSTTDPFAWLLYWYCVRIKSYSRVLPHLLLPMPTWYNAVVTKRAARLAVDGSSIANRYLECR